MLEEVLSLTSDELLFIGSLASALSALAAVVGLFFIAFQIRSEKRVTALNNNLSLYEKITEKYDLFCEQLKEDFGVEGTDFDKSRRSLINLMALFEQIAWLARKGVIKINDNDLVLNQLIDILEKLMGSEFASSQIFLSKQKSDVFSNLTWLVMKCCNRFNDYDFVRRQFSIRSKRPWMVLAT